MKYITKIDDEDESVNQGQYFKTLVKEAEEQGINKAWSLAQILEATDAETWNQIFGERYEVGCLEKISYADAQHAYESWLEKKNEIHIGDEVVFYRENRPDTVIVVTHIDKDGYIDGMDAEGTLYASKNPYKWVKTGRTFPEVARLLEAMKTRQEEANA